MTLCTALIIATHDSHGIPKQYQEVGGQLVIRRSVMAFFEHPAVTNALVVIRPEHRDLYERALSGLNLPAPVPGGDTWQESVRKGLEALAKSSKVPDLVMIHDAAEPLVDPSTVQAVYKALGSADGVVAIKPFYEGKKKSGKSLIIDTIDRTNIYQAHTPQAFHFEKILAAHRAVEGSTLVDDAAVAQKVGMTLSMILTNADALKIINPDEIDHATRLMAHAQIKKHKN